MRETLRLIVLYREGSSQHDKDDDRRCLHRSLCRFEIMLAACMNSIAPIGPSQ